MGIEQMPAIPMEGDRDLLVWAVLEDGEGDEVSRNLSYFAKPKYWKLQDPQLTYDVGEGSGSWIITLKARHSAPWTRIYFPNVDTTPSDNFFHIHPALPVQVEIDKMAFASAEVLKKEVRIQPFIQLFDGGYAEG
jgi:hypothetical protein